MSFRRSSRSSAPAEQPPTAITSAPAATASHATLAKQPSNLDYANEVAAFIGRLTGSSAGTGSGAAGARVTGSLRRGASLELDEPAQSEVSKSNQAKPPPKPPQKLTVEEQRFNRGTSVTQFAVEMTKKIDANGCDASLPIYLEVGSDGLAIRRRSADAELLRSFPLDGLCGWESSPDAFTFTAARSKGVHGDVKTTEARIHVRTTQGAEIAAACRVVADERIELVIEDAQPTVAAVQPAMGSVAMSAPPLVVVR